MKLVLDDEKQHRYLRVYDYYKELIKSGKLMPDTRLPSIRKCAAQLRISRTTVETAYMLLAAEGYILSRPQSGYYVAKSFPADNRDTSLRQAGLRQAGLRQAGLRQAGSKQAGTKHEKAVLYDFAASNVDRESFQFEIWRRYIKSALRQDERLLSYGEPQGEAELREALCDYLGRHRNVVCTPEHIVVGAGVQSLLHLLCPMIKDKGPVLFYNKGFKQGRTIFADHGFEIGTEEDISTKNGLPQKSLCYLTPSQMTEWGEVMHIAERMELIKEAFSKDILIVEDDYNSEFKYYNRPTPSLQGLAGGQGVVYLGTFSRLLLPSIRLSFMVLPPELLPLYKERGKYYNQTASKVEQIALCQFIRDGHLESQIRKTRKLYTAKAKKLGGEIKEAFGENATTQLGEAGFFVLAELNSPLTPEEIARRAEQAGVAVRPVLHGGPAGQEASHPRILLSCSTVPVEKYKEALICLKKAIFKE